MITPTQELLRAEKHIGNEDYDAARKILESLNDPTAKEWLAYLDDIAPVTNKPKIACNGILWFFFFVITLIPTWALLSNHLTVNFLRNQGLVVEGQVIDRYTERTKNGKSFHLVYSFEVDGKTYSKTEFGVPQAFYDEHHVTSPITVYYDANDPINAMILDAQQPGKWTIPTLATLFLIIVFLSPMIRYFIKKLTTQKDKQKRKIISSP